MGSRRLTPLPHDHLRAAWGQRSVRIAAIVATGLFLLLLANVAIRRPTVEQDNAQPGSQRNRRAVTGGPQYRAPASAGPDRPAQPERYG